MKIRLFASLAIAGLIFGIAAAGDRKKADQTPETPPQPEGIIPPPAILPAPQKAPAPIALPSGHYLEGHYPQYFPAEPQFPLTRELAYQEEAAGLLGPQARQIIKTFVVADLIVPMPPVGTVGKPLTDKLTEKPKTLEADLIKKITATVEPKSWASAGGRGTIEYFPIGMALVVNNTPTVQAAIEKYLDGLRRIQDTQFEVKVMVVTVTDAGLEKAGFARDFGPCCGKPGEVRSRIKFLSAEDMAGLNLSKTEMIDATMPTLAVLNGQEGCVSVGQVEHFLTKVTVQAIDGKLVYSVKNEPQELGTVLKLEPTLSADQKFVRLKMSCTARDVAVRPVPTIPMTMPPRLAELEGKEGELAPVVHNIQVPRIVMRTIDETVTLPDGATVVMYGGPATFEQKVSERVPMLSDLPYISELFVQDKKVTSTNHLLVFATPRVIKAANAQDDCIACCATCDSKLSKLLIDYAKACKTGKAEDARRLAMECLVIDPTCFGKK
jgi:Bacterial type II and III secretion system protein